MEDSHRADHRATPITDHARALLALRLVAVARSGLLCSLATLAEADDVRLLIEQAMIEQAIEFLDGAAGDLEGELARIEDEDGE